jgi:hypothetical protein
VIRILILLRRTLPAAALMLASQAVAADSTLTIHDHTGRGFPPDLVQLALGPKAADDARLHVVDDTGTVLPVQLSGPADARVASVVTSLPAAGQRALQVVQRDGDAPAPRVTITRAATGLELANSLLSVRVPAPGVTDGPVPATSLPAPILGFRSGDSAWRGAGRVLTDQPVARLTVALTADGPVFAEVLYAIEWQGGGYYRARIRVIDQVPVVRVREEYDLGALDGSQFWELDLAAGWQPDTVETASKHGNGGGDPKGRVLGLAAFTKGKPVQYLLGDQAWGRLSHLGCWQAADREAAPDAWPLAGVVPLRKGLWRRSNALEVHAPEPGALRVRLPMSARHAVWPKDITSETSPFSTQEHEPGQSKTYGRRLWGLALAHLNMAGRQVDRPCYELRRYYGIIGLDRYKDFVLSWPDANTSYPRLPGTTPTTDASAVTKLLSEIQARCRYYFVAPEASHHSTSGHYRLAYAADAALAGGALTAQQRSRLRALLALLTYVYEDADMMSYANGHHHGNPNMGTARFWSGPCFLALLPDHPLFARWRAHMLAYGRYNISTQVAPGGGYLEFGAAYHMHGYARTTHGLPGLAAAGADIGELLTHYHAPDWRYYLDIVTPHDSRWQSRVVPGMANSPPGNTEHYLEAAGSLRQADPALASALKWAWLENGANSRHSPLAAAAAALPTTAPKLGSAHYPGVGVVFRAHQGPDETYMLFRCGFQWSHWYIDPGHFLLHSRGATLVPFQPYQYGGLSDKGFDPYNTVRFGHPENQWPHGWGDSVVVEHAFSAPADYAHASTGFPDWFITPGISPLWRNTAGVTASGARKLATDVADQKPGAFTWDRQIMFVKGANARAPNYFVIRDSTTAADPATDAQLASWLYLNLLGTADSIRQDASHLTATTEWDYEMDIFFTTPPQPAFHEQRLKFALHNANIQQRLGKDAPISPNWVTAAGKPWTGRLQSNKMHEQHVIMRIPGAAGQGFFWLLFPRPALQASPRVSTLAPGVMRVLHEAGTDTVFLGADTFGYAGGQIAFSGRAGVIRQGRDEVTVALLAGVGYVRYRATDVSGTAPQSVVLENRHARGEMSVPVEAPAATGTVAEAPNGGTRFTAPAGVYVRLTQGSRGVRGVGPFDLVFRDDGIAGSVSGPTRSLVVTWPDAITRPMYRMDGRRYCAGWADDHSIGKSQTTPQFALAFGVTDGEHAIEISEWTYPELPPEPARRRIR